MEDKLIIYYEYLRTMFPTVAKRWGFFFLTLFRYPIVMGKQKG